MGVLLNSFKVDTSRRSVLLLIALVLLPIMSKGVPAAYSSVLLIAQALAVFLLLKRRSLATDPSARKSLLWLSLGIGSAMVADLHTNWGVLTQSVNETTAMFQEFAYSAFLAGFVALSIRYFLRGGGPTTTAIAWTAGLVHGLLSIKFILIPYFDRSVTPTVYYSITSVAYSILSSVLFGILFAATSRIIGFHHFIFAQATLLLLSGDFYIRYQWAAITQTTFSWTEPFWGIAFSCYLWLAIERKTLFPERTSGVLAPETSIRARMAQLFLAAVLIITASFLLLGVYATETAFDLTVLLLWLFVVWLLANVMSLYFSNKINTARERISLGSEEFRDSATGVLEIDEIIQAHEAAVAGAIQLQADLAKAKESEKVAKLSQQIAHDIRSPLAALSVLESELNQLPEDTRLLLRSAVQRIRDISNGLLSKRSETQTRTEGRPDGESLIHLLATVEPLISEKRTQYRKNEALQLDFTPSPESYGLFTQINPTEFKRVLSNLIDNAVESLPDSGGKVTVALSLANGMATLDVLDTGRGIAHDLLPELGKVRGLTRGKDSGSGLGLFHAITQLEAAGGGLQIRSDLGKGTCVTLQLPLGQTPDWFVPELKLAESSQLIIVDDDESIHQVWRSRFEKLKPSSQSIQLLHFRTPLEFAEFLAEETDSTETPRVYLMDYELLGHRENGLDLIERFGLASKSILVTGRFDDPFLKSRAARIAVPLIPKSMAGLVPIRIR